MKKTLLFFIGALVLIFISSCSEETPTAPKKSQKTKPPVVQSTPKAQPMVQQKKKSANWPFISEDDHEMTIADNLLAKNFLLIFDGSGSMNDSECSLGKQKITVAKEAVVEWSKSIPHEANLGLYVFHNNTKSTLPLTSGKRENFIRTIQNIHAGGKTPLSEALSSAYASLTKQARRQLGYGEYSIVVVTDGIANNESRLFGYIREILDKTPINIYSIGFCIGQNHSLNQAGKTIYRSADNPNELKKGLKEVLAESESFDITSFND